MIHLIQLHPLWAWLLAYFLFSNGVGAMEKPDDKSGQLYRYVYRFSHGLAGNLNYALKSKFPQYVDPGDIAKQP